MRGARWLVGGDKGDMATRTFTIRYCQLQDALPSKVLTAENRIEIIEAAIGRIEAEVEDASGSQKEELEKLIDQARQMIRRLKRKAAQ